MSDLPFAPSRVHYNGVDFGPETETVDCSIRPVPDASGRTAKYVQYNLTIKTYIADLNQQNGATTDGVMEAIQTRLTQYGGEFRYEQVGLGDLVINVPGEADARDVVWGPKTQLLRFKPLGQYACELLWQVQFCIPVCPEAAVYQLGVMEYVYSWRTSINHAGETTRTLTGHVAVPQTRGSGPLDRTLSDQADRLREQITPGTPVGFRRTTRDFTLSEDRCRLSWTIVDQEWEGHGNYPPPGVLSVEASHDVRTTAVMGVQWRATLRATYELAKDTPRGVAVQHFLALFKDRREQARSVFFKGAGGRLERGHIIPYGFDVSEPQIFGRRSVSISCSYALFCTVFDVFAASGLWRPVPGSDWQRWASSLSNAAWAARGNAGLAFSTDQDYIVDLCMEGASPRPVRPQANDRPTPPARPGRGGDELKGDQPTPEVSWLRYESWLRVELEDNVTVLQPLPATPQPPRPAAGAGGAGGAAPRGSPVRPIDVGGFVASSGGSSSASADGGGPVPGPGTPLPPAGGAGGDAQRQDGGGPVVQRTTATTYWAVLHGFAIRAGFPAGPPALVSVGGAAATPANNPRKGDGVSQALLGAAGGVALTVVRWQLRYVLSGAPFNVPYMDSPFAG